MHVITVEGIGNSHKGLHPIQVLDNLQICHRIWIYEWVIYHVSMIHYSKRVKAYYFRNPLQAAMDHNAVSAHQVL